MDFSIEVWRVSLVLAVTVTLTVTLTVSWVIAVERKSEKGRKFKQVS